MQGFDFWFFNYNAFTTIFLLSFFPIFYLLGMYYQQRDMQVVKVLLPSIISLEVLLYAMWFLVSFPVFIAIKVIIFLNTGDFQWVWADFVLIIFFAVYIGLAYTLPKRLTKYLMDTYKSIEKEYEKSMGHKNPYEKDVEEQEEI
ncbi:MAG: hypothetical protein ACTSUV_05310 [Candidatus Ranarchaeia archaeon]